MDSWDDVLDGTMEAKQSLQPNALELHSSTHCPLDQFGGEDCLYLNVYTRCLADEREEKDCGLEACEVLEPVIVFLHGGVFALGSCEAALYGPDILLDRDNVVLVGVNSRLGALGFLSLECDEAPGECNRHHVTYVAYPIHPTARQPRSPRPVPCSTLDPGKHRQLRRGPGQRDLDGRELGRHVGHLPPGVAAVPGPVPPRDRDVRHLDQCAHAQRQVNSINEILQYSEKVPSAR